MAHVFDVRGCPWLHLPANDSTEFGEVGDKGDMQVERLILRDRKLVDVGWRWP